MSKINYLWIMNWFVDLSLLIGVTETRKGIKERRLEEMKKLWGFTPGIPRDYIWKKMLEEKKKQARSSKRPIKITCTSHHLQTKITSRSIYVRNHYENILKEMKHSMRSLNIHTWEIKVINKVHNLPYKLIPIFHVS